MQFIREQLTGKLSREAEASLLRLSKVNSGRWSRYPA